MAIHAVGRGAQDYLVKGQISSNVLVQSIRYAMERSKASRMLQESEDRFRLLAESASREKIEYLSFHDKYPFSMQSLMAL